VRGICRAGGPKECTAIDTCHEPGVCDSALGSCTAPRKAEGAPCDDGDLCTVGDACSYGFCQRGTPVECQPAGECWLAGKCDPATGACSQIRADDGTSCSIGECKRGTCVEKKCGCSAGSGAMPGFALLALAALRMRRRKSS
jgi:MYXO-CTERM domain-containing protein